jgi:hypothetical protein
MARAPLFEWTLQDIAISSGQAFLGFVHCRHLYADIYLKVRPVWLRTLAFMFGISLIGTLPIFLLLLGCGTV